MRSRAMRASDGDDIIRFLGQTASANCFEEDRQVFIEGYDVRTVHVCDFRVGDRSIFFQRRTNNGFRVKFKVVYRWLPLLCGAWVL